MASALWRIQVFFGNVRVPERAVVSPVVGFRVLDFPTILGTRASLRAFLV